MRKMNKTLTEIYKIVSENDDIVKFDNPISIICEPTLDSEAICKVDAKIASIELDSWGREGEKTIISLEVVDNCSRVGEKFRFDYFIKENCTDIYFEKVVGEELDGWEGTSETIDHNLPIRIWRNVLNELKKKEAGK